MCQMACNVFWATHKELEAASQRAFVLGSLVPELTNCLQYDPHTAEVAMEAENISCRRSVIEALLSLFNGRQAIAATVAAAAAEPTNYQQPEVLSDALIYFLFMELEVSSFKGGGTSSYSGNSTARRERLHHLHVLYQEEVVQLLCQLLGLCSEQFLRVLMLQYRPVGGTTASPPAVVGGASGDGSSGGDDVHSIPGNNWDPPLDVLTTAWAAGVRVLDNASPVLIEPSLPQATALLVRQLSRLLNAISTKAQSIQEGSPPAASPEPDINRCLVEYAAPTLSRWESGHHHTALRDCGDDMYELMTISSTYF